MYQETSELPSRCMIADMPEHERPRERLRHHGADALTNAELLAILLRTGTRERPVLDLARDILRAADNDLARLSTLGIPELRAVKGIGATKATEIHAAFALARRLSRSIGNERPKIRTAADAANHLREKLRGKTQEELHVLLLDTRNFLMRDETVTVGLADRSQAHAREVFRNAIRENSCRIVLVHNHPSGDPMPAPQDVECTRGLVSAGRLIGIEVMDHVVIGTRTPSRDRDYVSLRELNLM